MLTVLKTALEVGLIYGLVALALFISFSILNIADLSTDGCFTLGCAVGAMLTIAGHPLLALPAAMAAGMLSGFITAFLQTRLGVESILAGIISNTGLYTINLAVMGFSSNVSITGRDTVFSLFKAQPVEHAGAARAAAGRDRGRAHPVLRHVAWAFHPRDGRQSRHGQRLLHQP